MIEIDRTRFAEPADFDARCRQKGLQWLVDHPKATRKGNARPRDYWTPFKPELADAFRDLCAYSAMYEPVGTVDHFEPVDANEARAYDWDNYRFASAWINSSKNKRAVVLDPLWVREGWFELILPSLQLVLVPGEVPAHLHALAEQTLIDLHLCDDERVLRQRRAWLRKYEEGKMTLDGLWEVAPLIAAALAKQNALKVGG
jgi:hypothetical protein